VPYPTPDLNWAVRSFLGPELSRVAATLRAERVSATKIEEGRVIESTSKGTLVMTTDRITVDAEVMQGKPVIRGTRVTVDLLLRKLSEGATEADILDAYPQITSADIRAALAYAADAVAHEVIVLTAPSRPATS
jgi:uncharacterized protein (DUF433 family)